MAYIKAHTFTTVQDAERAIELINTGEGIPVSADAVTRTYATYQEKDGYIYILSDQVTESYLGQPEIIEINFDI